MTSVVQDIDRKRDGDRETLGTKAGENGEKFRTIWKEEIDELLPNNIARIVNCKTRPEFAQGRVNDGNERGNRKSIEVIMF